MFYKLSLNSNHTNYKKFKNELDNNKYSVNKYLNSSIFIMKNETETVYIFYLQDESLYYIENYKYFEELKTLSEGCITLYNKMNLTIEEANPIWINNNRSFLTNYFTNILAFDYY